MLINNNHSSSFNRVKMTMTVTSTVISIILMHGVQAHADTTTQQSTQQTTTATNTTESTTNATTANVSDSATNTNATAVATNTTNSTSSTLAASQTNTNTNQQSVSGSTTDAATNTTTNPAKQASNSAGSTDSQTSGQQATANFDESTASTAYLMKGVNVYDAATGTTVKQVTTDNNVQILRQADSVNGRVYVELKDSKVIGYVDQSAIQSTPQVVNDDNGVTHYTRADLDSIIDSLNKSSVWAPKVESGTLNSDITGLDLHNNQTGEDVKLKVWDSWPVENQDGTVANYHGYRLVVGLTAPADNSTDWYYSKMGLFAQKIGGSDDISSWQYLGNVFNTFGEGADLTNDQYLKYMEAEWSGSTIMVNANDDSLRFFYTNYGTKGQILTTAKVYVEPKDSFDWNSGLTIDHSKATDHKSIFAGDGSLYQTASQEAGFLTSFGDSNSLRDPHVVYSNGEAYLVFESNTGLDDGYQGINDIYNKAYYGMSDEDFQKALQYFLNNKGSAAYDKAILGNASVGIVKLNSDFSVANIEKPLVAFNGISDEVERPNLFEHDGKWYLFVTAHGWHMSTDNVRITLGENGQMNYMFGFVSDDGILGHYKPLNGNGLVLASDNTGKDYTYSFLVVPNSDNSNQFIVTSYLDVRTFGASFVLEINGDQTSVVNNKVYNQGALTTDGPTYDVTPQQNHIFSGYIYDGSSKNGGYRWYENNQPFTGFQYYTGAYYWFEDGVRQNNSWHEAWGKWYYTGDDGRAVQGIQNINGQTFDFGNDNTYYMRSSGYLYDGSPANGGYRWYENGQLYTGFRFYTGTYYWFIDGVRQNAGWRQAWGLTYYTDADGRAVQGLQWIDGKLYNFGTDNTFYVRPLEGYIWDGSPANGGYRWYENGQLFTGFRYYTGTYYWFIDGVRQNAGWREAWGYKYYTDQDGRAVQGWQNIDGVDYYFGDDNTYYLR